MAAAASVFDFNDAQCLFSSLTFFTFRNSSTLIFLKSCLLFEIAKIVLTPSFLMSLELLIFQIIKEIININPI